MCAGTHYILQRGVWRKASLFVCMDVCARAPLNKFHFNNISHHERHAPVQLLFQKNALFILCSCIISVYALICVVHIAFSILVIFLGIYFLKCDVRVSIYIGLEIQVFYICTLLTHTIIAVVHFAARCNYSVMDFILDLLVFVCYRHILKKTVDKE